MSRTRTYDRYIKRPARMADPDEEAGMDDAQIHGTIERLVAEEHELWDREAAGRATDADRRRLQELKVSLDQCWDFLRQRRALEEFGLDADAAVARPPDVVERYQQ
jgi:hypothetical protein